MVDAFISKPLGLAFIITAHMVFHGWGHEQVTGFLGSSVTLRFTFNTNITNLTKIGVYIKNEKKITDNRQCRSCLDIYPENASVLYHIANLTSDHSKLYYIGLMGSTKVIESNKVELILQEETENVTVFQTPTSSTIPLDGGSPSFFSSHIVIILVVFPAVLFIAALPLLICHFDKTKDKEQQQQQQTSNPTLQETIEMSNSPAPSVIYSVLNFPSRPSAVVEMSSSDTDYAVVSCLPEKRSEKRC